MRRKNVQGTHTTEEIQAAIIEFMRSKGGIVSNEEVDQFINETFNIQFAQISHVMWNLRRNDSRVVKAERGHSRLIEDVNSL